MLLTEPSFITAPTGIPRHFPTPPQAQARTPDPSSADAFAAVLARHEASGKSRAQAMRAAVSECSEDAHRAWLDRENGR